MASVCPLAVRAVTWMLLSVTVPIATGVKAPCAPRMTLYTSIRESIERSANASGV